MAKQTKTEPKKTSASKKPTAKKPAEKKSAAKKPATKAAKPAKLSATTRRPDPNDTPHKMMIVNITDDLMDLVRTLDNYAVNLRALDRQRHNGVGMKRLGFIEAALRCSKALRTFELGVCA